MTEYKRIDKDGIRHYPIPELDGRKLPSSTTVIGILAKPALIQWSSNVGVDYFKQELLDKISSGEISADQLKEIDTSQIVKDAKAYHKEMKGRAADIGTRVHHKIQEFINITLDETKQEETVEIDEDIKKPFYAFLDWWESNQVHPAAQEMTVWSERGGGYAGTLDFLGSVNDVPYILDFKTGKYIYAESIMQVASYFFALKERQGKDELKNAGILRLDKETRLPEFRDIPLKELKHEFKKFLCLVEYWHLAHRKKK